MKNFVLLKFLGLQVVYDVMESIFANILEILNLFKALDDKTLHFVIIEENTAFELLDQIRERNQNFLETASRQLSHGGVLGRLNRSRSWTIINKGNFAEVVSRSEKLPESHIFLLVNDFDLAGSI